METSFKILNASSSCPYNECDGSGISLVVNEATRETKGRYCRCREERIYNNRLSFANIPSEFTSLTINSFNTNLYKKQESINTAAAAKKMTVNYIRQFEKFQELGKGLYYYSDTKGSGKTRLAVSLGNVLLKHLKKQVKFITCSDLLKEIKNTYNQDSQYTESQLIESLNQVDILIIDDIGVEKLTSWVNEMLFSIFDNRMKYKKITIFTSNCIIEDLEHDERIKSRLTKMCVPIKMPEEDIRKYLAIDENRELQDLLLR
ncbi:DNA replication protein DnaC [Clostridium saccharobutylicum]|uniref:ATP-binding protein n=1 Tax=Clostridium saccharobutylicum TaxID=169679 RepID=UPI0009D045D3|nr:ATP-binding protein [Clostridium saccharobutylicum]OOM17160.1 DNA replication protein DnaC [Clostridium saccharobutylicum]